MQKKYEFSGKIFYFWKKCDIISSMTVFAFSVILLTVLPTSLFYCGGNCGLFFWLQKGIYFHCRSLCCHWHYILSHFSTFLRLYFIVSFWFDFRHCFNAIKFQTSIPFGHKKYQAEKNSEKPYDERIPSAYAHRFMHNKPQLLPEFY